MKSFYLAFLTFLLIHGLFFLIWHLFSSKSRQNESINKWILYAGYTYLLISFSSIIILLLNIDNVLRQDSIWLFVPPSYLIAGAYIIKNFKTPN